MHKRPSLYAVPTRHASPARAQRIAERVAKGLTPKGREMTEVETLSAAYGMTLDHAESYLAAYPDSDWTRTMLAEARNKLATTPLEIY